MEVTEGTVTVAVPEQSGDARTEDVFFNPDQQLNRDLTVATLSAYREREPRAESYFDAMAASGIRGVRAAADGWTVSMADVDPDAVDLCRENLARNDLDGTVHYQDANAVLHDAETVFDVTDLDPFGSPIPFADAAFANTRDLVAVTATDTAPLCGAHFASGKRRYSAVPRNTEYHPEMGLRILLSALARTAARYDVGVTPILSHVSDHYVRTYLDLSHRATDANESIDALGHVYHCPECLHREHEYGLTADPPAECQVCGGTEVLTAGPVWLEQTHDPAFVEVVRGELDETMATATRADRLLDRLAGELDVPMHFDQHRLYKRWSEPAIAMDDFLETLSDAGFEASRTHYDGTTFKTTARVDEIRAALH
ncbi:N2,N2-dimethylguanosine tRNA methyltransferase [Halanaeroarchaeum sp. HSR-CO]|uniref:tRNA (guanine(26)-N(2))-dimethyltransferase n=1 Tax=Halanaeroarchaeum sp. HSR-CO TaxID=2866382 RepID=UPI00217CDF6E|nr:tRNA (guanine(26)-N(2))-dimethyltransferase [Halanaeroarchaeum sp. HSR-CO]UWG48920.1 N2,N2-dimethylguanosine tRNA methyltransferase [Halanaeroarchaeum sp. HSR-CO]